MKGGAHRSKEAHCSEGGHTAVKKRHIEVKKGHTVVTSRHTAVKGAPHSEEEAHCSEERVKGMGLT